MSNTNDLYSIQSTTLTGLADAVRGLTGKSGALSPADMINEIEDSTPSPIIPLAVDYKPAYVYVVDTTHKWHYNGGTNNRSDIYAVERGHHYLLRLGSLAGSRLRGLIIDTNPIGVTTDIDGILVADIVAPSAYEHFRFVSPINGYLAVTKDTTSTDGIETNLVDITVEGGVLIDKSITSNGTYSAMDDDADGYSTVTVNVSGGGGGSGIGDLLATQSLGHITVSSTSAINLNKTVTVTGINDYDLLIVITSIDTPITGLHATTVAIGLSSDSSLSTKSSAAIGSLKQNLVSKFDKTTVKIVASTSAFGIYPYSATISNGVASLAMYGRYSGTNTENINGDYTTRVYGIKLYQDYY